MNTKIYTTLIDSKKAHVALITLGTVFVLVVVFQAGVSVGYQQASFAYKSGDNYYKVFGVDERRAPKTPGMMQMMQGRMPASHGALGSIVQITLPTLVVASEDGTEKVVRLQNSTLVREGRNTLKPSDLKIGDFVVIVGEPNAEAEIDARFVRIMPKPVQN